VQRRRLLYAGSCINVGFVGHQQLQHFFVDAGKHQGMQRSDVAFITTVLEYCIPVWHYALTNAQTEQLEGLQKRAIHIILNSTRGMPYMSMLFVANLSTLASCRDISCKFFEGITLPSSCLHHLLPPQKDHSLTSRLRTYEKFPRVFTCTKQYCSFIQYGINNYQERLTN